MAYCRYLFPRNLISLTSLLIFFCFICGCTNTAYNLNPANVEKSVVSDDLLLQRRMSGFEQFASIIRELEFKKPVKYISIKKESVKELLDSKINEQYSENEFKNKIEAYVKIGLLDSPDGVREIMLGMLGEQVAGFYDTDNHVLYVINDLGLGNRFDALIYIHELTHALQDQYFNLNSLGIADKENDDKAIAVMSLIEGDATLVILHYFTKYESFDIKMMLTAISMDSSKLNNAPYVMQRSLMFPYSEGLSLLKKIHKRSGWSGVNEAYKEPPASSEQVLHPEKYLEKSDEPVHVNLPDFKRLLGKKWLLLDSNVMGELNIRILFDIYLGKKRSFKPSAGWGGDRYAVYKNVKDSSSILVWMSTWDTEKDAEEFFAAYKNIINKKYHEIEFIVTERAGFTFLSSENLYIYIAKNNSKVLTLEAPDKILLQKLLIKLNDYNNKLKFDEELK